MSGELLFATDTIEKLKALPTKQIPELCGEIREFLIENVERSGGHLGSNLGATELSVAIHRVFNSPTDHIIFDVGHQSYVHKMFTGRRDKFDTLRKTGGLSGFTKMSESEHDAFGAGHSSTSISAALGYAEADRIKGSDAYTVAVLGDGAYTGGMVHEALNNCDPDLKLIIILNENGMSISLNKGTFASYLSRVRISRGYMGWKKGTKSFLSHIPLIGKPIHRLLTYIKTKIKNLFYSANYFEDLGLYYIGPIDGNNYKKVENALTEAKRLGQCVVVHLKTEKGKGYANAENAPDKLHSVSAVTSGGETFHSQFADKLVSLAENDEKVVAVTPAMGIGTGLDLFGERFSSRYFDVGIAEGHALTFCAGLAASGMKPYVAIYSTFLQRGYDSVLHDIALQGLPVKIFIDRASLAASDGATHHGIFDVSFLSHIPGITIFSPISYSALEAAIEYANAASGPVAVRYPNASQSEAVVNAFYAGEKVGIGVRADFDVADAPDKVFITYGSITERVLRAKELLSSRGIKVGVILLEMLKPYGKAAEEVLPYLKGARRIVFAEEGIKNGGAAMLLREALAENGFDLSACEYDIAAIDDNFASPAEACDLYDYVGLSPRRLADFFKE